MKTGLGAHSRPRLRAHYSRTAPRLRAQRALGAVSWRVEHRILAPGCRIVAPGRRIVAPGCRVAGRLLQYPRLLVAIQNCIVTPRPMLRALQAVSHARPTQSQALSQHAAALSQRCIATLLRHIATQTVAPSHDTIFVSRLTLGKAMRACAPLAPVRRPTVSQRCIGRVDGSIAALLRAPTCTRSAVS